MKFNGAKINLQQFNDNKNAVSWFRSEDDTVIDGAIHSGWGERERGTEK